MTDRLHTQDDLDRALARLSARDGRIARLLDGPEAPPLRRRADGLEGLAQIVMGQQLSTASAAAIWGRLHAAIVPFDAEGLAAHPEEGLKAAGLSRAKIRTVRVLADAVRSGALDFESLKKMPDPDAHAALVALPGVGPWTAELYLLFCEGRADIWPAGDLALQVAVADALGLEARPKPVEAQGLAEAWHPFRGAAAHLFWWHYRKIRGRAGVPV